MSTNDLTAAACITPLTSQIGFVRFLHRTTTSTNRSIISLTNLGTASVTLPMDTSDRTFFQLRKPSLP